MVLFRASYSRNNEESFINYNGDKSNTDNFSQIYWIDDFVLEGYEDKTTYFNLQSQRLFNDTGISILVETISISVFDNNNTPIGYLQVAQTYKDEGTGSVSGQGVQSYSIVSSNGIFNKALFFQITFKEDLTRSVVIVCQ